MLRFWFAPLLSVLIASFAGPFIVLAQDTTKASASTPEGSFVQEVDARNSVAKFVVALSPANAKVNEEVVLSIRVVVEKGWHIGATITEADSIGFPTKIQFLPVGLEALDSEFTSSKPAQKQKLDVGTQLFMDGEFSWTRKYRVASKEAKYSGTGTIRFQACDDVKCLPPQTVKFELGQASLVNSAASSAASSDKSQAPEISDSASLSEKTVGAPMVLSLEPCALTRTRPQVGNLVSLILFGKKTEKMVWKGTIPGGKDAGVSIYLPQATEYSLRNTASDGTIVSNTATYISVDQNGDEVLADWEATAVNRPIRVHDTMYRVTEIDAQNKKLTLQQLDMPLKGSLIGFRCPDFEFTAFDGSVISNKSILGKTTVLDIWAVTCHNCYEGFPKIQRALEKHSSEKLRVILLTVDTDRRFYDSQAPRLFQTYGGGTWPQVMIPGGFDGALTIGDYGFGSVVVDETGIVRAVGVHGIHIEGVIDDVFKQAAQKAPPVKATTQVSHANVKTEMDRESMLNCYPGLTERLDALRAENKLLTKEMVEGALANPMGFNSKPNLPAPSNVVLSPGEIAARLRNAKLQVGWFFKCNHCDNWHLNFGAGFPVAEGGVVATCRHVLSPPGMQVKEGYLVVLDTHGKVYNVEGVIASDEVSDCALLKIAGAEELLPLAMNLAPKVGDEVYVLSNPMGMSDFFSRGLINRIFINSTSQELSQIEGKRRMRLNVGADWAPGSSGAPIVDQSANLIGIVSAVRQLMGPAESAQPNAKTQGGSSGGLTNLFTAHEASTTTAIEMLLSTP